MEYYLISMLIISAILSISLLISGNTRFTKYFDSGMLILVIIILLIIFVLLLMMLFAPAID